MKEPKSPDEEYLKITSTEQLAEIFRDTRKRQKITIDKIAKFADLSRYTILRFENQKTDIRLAPFLKLLKLCNLELQIRIKRK